MTLQWTPAFSTGDATLDARHAELFRRAQRFLASARGGGSEDVVDLLADLHAHATETFALEEAWMGAERYAGLLRHKAEHDRFLEDLVQLAEDHDRHGPAALGASVVAWLSSWLAEHGRATDAELGRALARKKSA